MTAYVPYYFTYYRNHLQQYTYRSALCLHLCVFDIFLLIPGLACLYTPMRMDSGHTRADQFAFDYPKNVHFALACRSLNFAVYLTKVTIDVP